MLLSCPFCHAPEQDRVDAVDQGGRKVLLVMFDCPFTHKFYEGDMGPDEKMQSMLEAWRKEEGEQWLENIGPVMKAREERNIERYKRSLSN